MKKQQVVQERTSKIGRRYGWIPDLPDHRDFLFAPVITGLPPKTNNLPGMPPAYDQGQLGSCTANAIAGAIEFEQKKQGQASFTPSRLGIYYNERVMEGTVKQDAGAMIRDGVSSTVTKGVFPETMRPYDVTKFTDPNSKACIVEGLKHQTEKYMGVVLLLQQIKGCLAAGYPVIFGFTVYESFESPNVARTGKMPMPKRGERKLGGHAVVAVDYDDSQAAMLVRNSWGQWGLNGYFWMPYDFIGSPLYTSDGWTIQLVE